MFLINFFIVIFDHNEDFYIEEFTELALVPLLTIGKHYLKSTHVKVGIPLITSLFSLKSYNVLLIIS